MDCGFRLRINLIGHSTLSFCTYQKILNFFSHYIYRSLPHESPTKKLKIKKDNVHNFLFTLHICIYISVSVRVCVCLFQSNPSPFCLSNNIVLVSKHSFESVLRFVKRFWGWKGSVAYAKSHLVCKSRGWGQYIFAVISLLIYYC